MGKGGRILRMEDEVLRIFEGQNGSKVLTSKEVDLI
jgi:hypothetical protein